MRYKPKTLTRVASLSLVYICVFTLLTIFSGTTQTRVSASTISWSSPTTIAGGMANVVSLIRPTDGAVFFIGDNCCTVPPGGGGSGGGIFIRTNATSFAGSSGNNFATAIRVSTDTAERLPGAVFDRNGNLHIVWGTAGYQIHYARYNASGALVDSKDIGGSSCGTIQCTNASIATSLYPTVPNELQVVYRAWSGQTNAVTHYALSSTDGGSSWSAPTAISAGFVSGQAQNSKIAMAPDGSVYAAYFRADGAGGNTNNIYVARKPAGGSWSTPVQVTTTTWGKEFGLTTDASGNAYVIFNGGGGCTSGEKFFVTRYFGGSWSSPAGVSGCSADRTSDIGLIGTPDGAVFASISITNVGRRYLHSADGVNSWTYGDIWTSNIPGGGSYSITAWNNVVLVGSKQFSDGSLGFVTAVGGGVIPTATPTPLPTNTAAATNTALPTNTVAGATNTALPTNTVVGVTNTPLPTNTVAGATNTVGGVTNTPWSTNTIGITPLPSATPTLNVGPSQTYNAQVTATVFAANAQSTATAVAYFATATARNQNATVTALAIPPTATTQNSSATISNSFTPPMGNPTATPYLTPVVRPVSTSAGQVRASITNTPVPLATVVTAAASITPYPTVTPFPALGVFGVNNSSATTTAASGNVPALGVAPPTATPTNTPLPTATPKPTATVAAIVADTGSNDLLRLQVTENSGGIGDVLLRILVSLVFTACLYIGWRVLAPLIYKRRTY